VSAIRWERLAGDTSIFAVKLALIADPDDGRGEDPDNAASWGALSIWARGANLTAHSDSGATFESVTWYLLPFLEWLVDNWDALLHEERLPCKVAADDAVHSLAFTSFPPPFVSANWEGEWQTWWLRHAMQAARHGGPLPDVVLRRWRDEIEISWRNRVPAGVPASVEFLASSGAERFTPLEIAQPLFEVTAEAAAYLLKTRPESPRIQSLSRSLSILQDDLRRGARLAWLAGLGRSLDSAMARWNEITTAVATRATAASRFFDISDRNSLVVNGSCHGTLLFGSASPTISTDDVLCIAHAMSQAAVSAVAPAGAVDSLARPEPVRLGRAAWTQGYDLAEWFREERGYADDEIPADMDRLLRDLGVTLETIRLGDSRIRAVSFGGDGLRSTTLVNKMKHPRDERLRFTLAHELCHLLVDRDKGARLAIVSGPWAPLDVERRANAFAAAFLMPVAAVARAVAQATGPLDDLQEVNKVAKALRTSLTATIERLHDLGYLDDVQQEGLKDSLTGPSS
jgi:Zn-dependent peptidase ImmA (M78 family)